MGYVGLPTALAARSRGARTIGIDTSASRLRAIQSERVDMIQADRELLARMVTDEEFVLSSSPSRISEADAVVICVPTPVDEHRNPALGALRAACSDAVYNAQPGQTIILTSTSYPGTTRDLLIEPLAARGLIAGQNVFVAFSPERIDPGNTTPLPSVPRVVGGATEECTRRAMATLRLVADEVVPVSSPEAAEMTKLLENSFRAVNIAFANEIADACVALNLDPREVIEAAATKPYGFMPFYPGTGVGGHCIPCDPHYLLWQLRSRRAGAPILAQAMEAIAERPRAVVDMVGRELSALGEGLASSHVLIVGAAYKPGVEDVRESPAVEMILELLERDAKVDFHDPLVPSLRIDDHQILLSVIKPQASLYDAVIVSTLHPNTDYNWLRDARILVDPSGQFGRPKSRLEESPPARTQRVQERRVAEARVPIEIRD